tara:strand:+ start:27399 stop:29102 length:1704 start_codon:yes stop_codon:yes gene_type:complete
MPAFLRTSETAPAKAAKDLNGETDEMSNTDAAKNNDAPVKLDALVIGAGFGGMYAIHRLREMNLSIRGIEAGSDVGGVWYWNRYPGARCDLMCIDYSYSFSDEIQQEWVWSEQYAAQEEILAYANFVADKLDLRRDFEFDTRVVSAKYDDKRNLWVATTDKGQVFEATYCIMATGPLTVPKKPDYPGFDDFKGEIYSSARWPHEKVDFGGKKVGLIGTGSTGIQIVPVVAEEAEKLFVFQRTPSFTLPMRNSKIDAEFWEEVRRNYNSIRESASLSPLGGIRAISTRPYFTLPREQRVALMEDSWKRGGLAFLGTFGDLLRNAEANEEVAEFVRGKISAVVDDPDTAERLKPRGYPIFARRPCLDTNYYEAFNKAHVHLADCIDDPIERITPNGIKTEKSEYELDVILLATGFDGLTGALLAFDVFGKEGRDLKEKWSGGARSYLGIAMEGFPNMFMVCGANGPSALANIITLNQQTVDWICDAITHMRANDILEMEAKTEAEDEWMDTVTQLAQQTLLSKADTWYVGANVKGKAKGLTMYTGGFAKYRDACTDVAQNDYSGFVFAR